MRAAYTSSISTNEKALPVNSRVAYRIANTRKPRKVAEYLIFPAAVDMVLILIGEEKAVKLKAIPLSN